MRHGREYMADSIDLASGLFGRRAVKAAPVRIAGDYRQQNLAEASHRLDSGLPIGMGDTNPLRLRQLPLEFAPFWRQLEETLPPIPQTRPLEDELSLNQLSEDSVQALFGDSQNFQQLGDGQLWMASDEMDNAMMGAPETVSSEDRIGLRREIAISEEQQLDSLTHFLLGCRIQALG